MTPSARIAAAIDILEGFGTTTQPADRFLKDWFRGRRFAGSGDRREITELVFHVLRHRAAFAHRSGSFQFASEVRFRSPCGPHSTLP